MSDDNGLGKRIREARKRGEFTLAQAARRLAVTETTFSKWESGKSTPRANKLQMLAGMLNVSLVWLLEGEERFEPTDEPTSQLAKLKRKVERIGKLQNELVNLTGEVAQQVEELRKTEQDIELLRS